MINTAEMIVLVRQIGIEEVAHREFHGSAV